jgi:hypothetical protein
VVSSSAVSSSFSVSSSQVSGGVSSSQRGVYFETEFTKKVRNWANVVIADDKIKVELNKENLPNTENVKLKLRSPTAKEYNINLGDVNQKSDFVINLEDDLNQIENEFNLNIATANDISVAKEKGDYELILFDDNLQPLASQTIKTSPNNFMYLAGVIVLVSTGLGVYLIWKKRSQKTE